jgi:uncharacterized repeat protein (TIGR02543 family)
MEPFNKYGILLQDCMNYPIFNAGGAVKNKIQARLTKALVSALLGALLLPLASVGLPHLLPKAEAASSGSLLVTSDGATNNPCGTAKGDSQLGVTIPSGSAIRDDSSYTIETWVKSDSGTNSGRQCAQLAFSDSLWGSTDSWNQRTGDNSSTWGSYYGYSGGNIVIRCGLSESDSASLCKAVDFNSGAWTHVALQKSVVAGVIRMTVFINGAVVVSRNVTGQSNSTLLRYAKFGTFSSSNSGKTYYGQIRVTSGSLYPTDGITGFSAPYDFSSSVSGGTVSNGATVVALFKPQTNSTTANLVDLTGNGSTLVSQVPAANVTATSDFPSPPPPAFSYATSAITATAGTAISADLANSTGGDINSYTVSPALPTGLSLDAASGSISGTPTSYSPTTTYVVTGTQASSGLTTTASVSITVNKPPTSVSIALSNGTVQVGVIDTVTATASVAGNVTFQTDLGVIAGCSSVATTLAAPFTATCAWNPTTIYYTMNATLTPSSSLLAASTSTPALTNIRGSLSLTSTGSHAFADASGSTSTNNALILNFPSGTGLITGQSFTIETWVKSSAPNLTMQLGAIYGDSFYLDRGQGIQIYNSGAAVNAYAGTGYMGTVNPTSALTAGSWQNIVFQRNYVAGQANQSFDTLFINGQVVAQWADGGYLNQYPGSGKSTGIKIGPFGGVTLIGPTQVVADTALYPTSGFSPSTTYSLGANTLALFQPSSTTCNSAVVAPASVTATYQTTTSSCSTDFPTATPVVTSVVANSGPADGGNSVVINGNNLVGLSAVKFGATTLSASNYVVNTFGTQITATVPPGTGSVDVSVSTTLGGTSTLTANDLYTYLVAPTVTGVSPTTGSTLGGSSVVITGTRFTSASAVTFGTVAATSFTVNSATQITATVPAGSAGAVDIKVTAPGGTSSTSSADQYTYTGAVSVTGISPSSGTTGGGTSVTITGTNFTSVTAVKFGTNAASGYTVNSSTQITATSPAGSAGNVDIVVTAGGSNSAISSVDQFTYTAAVSITGISPTSGPVAGGTSVVITGTNFTGATAVKFGATNAASYVVNSPTQITAVAPGGSAGQIDITVTSGTTSATNAADKFTYFALPTVTGLGTTVGLRTGGTSVSIIGTNFTSASTVMFGSTAAASVTYNSGTSLTAVSPAGTGAADVVVTTLGGSSTTSSSDLFTYYGTPTVSSVNPTSGPAGGTTSLTVTGTNFTGVTAVKFGTTNATSFTVTSDTQITAVAPAGTGTVDVRVTNPATTSAISLYDKYSYVALPAITSLSVSSGTVAGGTSVTITGTDLNNLLATGGVLFGSVAAQSVLAIDSTHIQVVSPASASLGGVHIILTNASGSSTQGASDLFIYTQGVLTLAFGTAPTGVTYGESAGTHSVTATSSPANTGSIVFASTTSTVCTVDSATGALTILTAGTCTISANDSGTTNFSAATQVSQNITVLGRAITIKAGSVTASYTGSVISPTNSVSVTVGSLAGSDAISTSSGTYTYSPSSPTAVGSYTITPFGVTFTTGSASNYIITYSTGTLMITAVGQTTLVASSTSSTAAYTGSAYSAQPAFSTTGGSGTGAVTYAISTGGTATGCSLSSSAANATLTATSTGTCLITATKAADNNYSAVTSAAITFTFTTATPTLTLALPSGATTAIYGTAVTITATVNTPGTVTFKVGGAVISGCSAVAAASTTATCSWTPAAVNAATALTADFTPSSANFSSLTTAGSVSINVGKRLITVTASTGQSKTYGATDPTLTYTITSGSLYSTDALTGALSRAVGESVGSYAISLGSLDNANYTITFGTATNFAITAVGQSALTFATTSYNVTFGGTQTVLASGGSGTGTISYSAGSSTACSVVSSTGVVSVTSGTGTCSITATKAADSNYNAATTSTPVTITVGKADQAITVTSTPASTGAIGSTYTPAASALGGTVAVSLDSTSTGCSLSGGVVTITGSGNCLINYSQSGNSNYKSAPVVQESISILAMTCSTSGSFYITGTEIPEFAGKNCKGTVTIPQGITKVFKFAFAFGESGSSSDANRDLTAVIFPASSLINIDQGAFSSLGLTSVTIPASVHEVGQFAFRNNPLTSATVLGGASPDGTYLDMGVFSNQAYLLGANGQGVPLTLTLGSGQIHVTDYFGSATTFANIDFGSAITEIGQNAFNSNGIAAGWIPVFPSTIRTFGPGAFTNSPNLKTIRFGSATTLGITSISTTAFDAGALTSVQDCEAPSATTVLHTYLRANQPQAVIWCNAVAPNAPTTLTAAAANGQVDLTWVAGASQNEAPTYDYLIQYSANGGSTWSTFAHTASTSTSITVTGLSNGTTYVFRVAAINLIGTGSSSATAQAKPLGLSFTPIFDTPVSTSAGFTVNVTNYDASYVWQNATVTVGAGSVSIGTAANGKLPLTVTGMSPGGTSSISITASKQNYSDGIAYASGTALQAALTPVIGKIIATTGGFTASITNFDSSFQWTAQSSLGNAAISATGAVVVTGVNPLTQVTLTVGTSRASYTSGSAASTVTTLQLLQVTYDGNGSTGGSGPVDSTQYASSATAVILENPSQSGFSLSGNNLVGWTLNSSGTGQVYQAGNSLQLASTSVTLYAKWSKIQYTATYYPNGATGGSVPTDSSTYTIGQSAPVYGNTGNLVRTGYSFAGWAYNSTETNVLYQSGQGYTVGTSNVTFYAAWTPNTYTVTYDSNGATGSPSKATDSYTTASISITLATAGTMAKTGYNFSGWGVAATSTPVADNYTVTTNTRLYAQWSIARFAVTYLTGTNGSGTAPIQDAVAYGANFTIAVATGLSATDGTYTYAFVSWMDGAGATYAPGQSYLMGAAPVTLTAQWTRIYNVKYSFNGGSVSSPIADQQKVAGDIITVSSVIPTRSGYTFNNWIDQGGRIATGGSSYTVADNHYLLYAQWSPISYTVTYDVNGGNTTPTEATHIIGEIFTLAAAPTKSGYDFAYWSDGGSTHYTPGGTYLVGAQNIALQAQWTPQVYQISFDFNGGLGTTILPISYTFGTQPASLPNTGVTRNDFTFSGWSSSATAMTGSYTFTPSGNVLLHAVWVSSIYRLTFNAGSGFSDTSTAKVTIGQGIALPSATRANYTLLGWSTQQSGGNNLNAGANYIPSADTTLFAQWTLQVFTVTFDGNHGTPSQTAATMTYGSLTPIVLPTATRSNYIFNGWYSDPISGYLLGSAAGNYSPTTSITAYAHWVQGSLNGMGAATQIAQVTVHSGIDSSFTAGSNGSTVAVNYTADSLPDGTVITAYLENSTARATLLLGTSANTILSLIIAWVATDGTVPTTAVGKPITMSISNASITAGSKVYGLIGNTRALLGIARVDGIVVVEISEDPAVVVAIVAPDAPTGVTATAVDQSSATISWTAPSQNGGSAVTGYTATSSAGQSCQSSTTSCAISGLTAGTAYTFTVVATNAIGNSAASAASTSFTIAPPVVTPPVITPPVITPPVITPPSSGGSGGYVAPIPAPVVTPAPTQTPVDNSTAVKAAQEAAAKALADKQAAEAAAKAFAEQQAADAAAAKAAQDAIDAAILKAAQEKMAADAKALADAKAAADAAAVKAAQEAADASAKAAAVLQAAKDAADAAAKAAALIKPAISLYSISSKLTLSTYDTAYLQRYVKSLKNGAAVTCLGYIYKKGTTLAKATTLARNQATAVCTLMKKFNKTLKTSILLLDSSKAPKSAVGAKWVAVSYRVDGFKSKP